MKKKLAIAILISMICSLSQSATTGGVSIYLPRQVSLDSDTIQLKDIAIIRAESALLDKAGKIKLGRFAMPGQKINIDRITILSRLASKNIDTKNLKFKGAREISVRRKEAVIESRELAKAARQFLNKQKNDSSIASFELYRKPDNKIISGKSGEVKLVPNSIKNLSANRVAVIVDARVEGTKVSSHQIIFRPSFKCRRAVAQKDIAAGDILTSNNIKIETYISPRPEPKDWKSPLGLVAKSNIKKGTTIKTSLAARKDQQILIERRDSVIIKVNSRLLSITANGEAVDEGKLGELIKVRNLDSRRVIVCKVNYDGSVSPVF